MLLVASPIKQVLTSDDINYIIESHAKYVLIRAAPDAPSGSLANLHISTEDYEISLIFKVTDNPLEGLVKVFILPPWSYPASGYSSGRFIYMNDYTWVWLLCTVGHPACSSARAAMKRYEEQSGKTCRGADATATLDDPDTTCRALERSSDVPPLSLSPPTQLRVDPSEPDQQHRTSIYMHGILGMITLGDTSTGNRATASAVGLGVRAVVPRSPVFDYQLSLTAATATLESDTVASPTPGGPVDGTYRRKMALLRTLAGARIHHGDTLRISLSGGLGLQGRKIYSAQILAADNLGSDVAMANAADESSVDLAVGLGVDVDLAIRNTWRAGFGVQSIWTSSLGNDDASQFRSIEGRAYLSWR
jgi:hypothetical protein